MSGTSRCHPSRGKLHRVSSRGGLRFAGICAALGLLASAAAAETLAVFVQPGEEAVSRHFADEVLPEIRRWAGDTDLELRVVDATAGAPAAVSLTPLIVHVGPRGRSIFQGRYADVGKLEHFVRTSRVVPAAGGTSTRTDVAVLQLGRAKIYAPLKITDLSGELPPGFDRDSFHRRARAAFLAGLEHFSVVPEVEIGPSDRAFYMDVHTFRSAEGELFLSLDLYSQFHCLDPVFRRFDEPVSGPETASRDLFARAARILESATLEQLQGTERGDGFQPVAASTPVTSWEALDLAIPDSDRTDASALVDVELPGVWRLDREASAADPSLVFRFPPPLERYSGQVDRFDAALELTPGESGPTLAGATGWVEAETGAVTFGEKDLDKAVHGKLKTTTFPASRFSLQRVEADGAPLTFGRTSRMVGLGEFSLLGWDVPVRVDAEVEPIIGVDGQPRLWVRARFGLDIDQPFGLEGPDGPPEASRHLLFFLEFLLAPSSH
ncbi:MAG: hypothetical protein MPN21_24565 [Thermoanaerobaculia bacterium]|nr:hypothetical protein [Thermoanaerobaculia bacterium]